MDGTYLGDMSHEHFSTENKNSLGAFGENKAAKASTSTTSDREVGLESLTWQTIGELMLHQLYNF